MFVVGGLGFELCVFVAGWRHALRSEWPFIIIIITLDDSVHEDMRTGIVMLDLFGGIRASLEALLRTGTVIKRYIYVDK